MTGVQMDSGSGGYGSRNLAEFAGLYRGDHMADKLKTAIFQHQLTGF
jgi:hypothetical protein